jgi:hypothetical protein
MRYFQERQTHLQQNKERAGRWQRILKMTSSVRLASAFLLLGGLLYFISVQYDESFLINEITKEENNPTKIHQ